MDTPEAGKGPSALADEETYLLPKLIPSSDRHANGRLKPGTRLHGGGNPLARAHYQFRMEWIGASTPEERAKVRAKVVSMVMEGNTAALKMYLEMEAGNTTVPIELSTPDGESIKVEAANTVAVILAALSTHPEAKLAVATALSGLPVKSGMGGDG
jgi:hypothetical protein